SSCALRSPSSGARLRRRADGRPPRQRAFPRSRSTWGDRDAALTAASVEGARSTGPAAPGTSREAREKRNHPSIAGLDSGNITPMGNLARIASFAGGARLALLAPALLGCHGVSNVSAVYTVPASLDELSESTFFDQPWPNDLRLENGSPRIEG